MKCWDLTVEKCHTCLYWDRLTVGSEIGLCKRFPPVMTVDRAVETKDVAYWGRPVTDRSDGCGEHKPKEV